MNIKLGDRVRDVVTGFSGVVTAKCEYINGCVQFGITPEAKNGAIPDTQYLDYKRLEIRGKPIKLPSEDTGGPQVGAPKAFNP